MAPMRRPLSSPPSVSRSSSSSTAIMLLLMMGYVFALSEKLQSEFKNLCGNSISHNSSSRRSDAPPASPALEPTRQPQDEQDLHAPDREGEGLQQKPKQRNRASNRLEFSVAAFLRKFSSPSSHSTTVSSTDMARAQKQQQQQQRQQQQQQRQQQQRQQQERQQSRAPYFAARYTASGDSLLAAAAQKGSGATEWARKVPAAASTSRSRRTDKTLCLDLDETLIHARGDVREMGENRFDFILVLPQRKQQQGQEGHQHGLKGLAGAGRQQQCSATGGAKWRGAGGEAAAEKDAEGSSCKRIFVRKRPHLKEFLEAASQMFEVVLFTAAPAEFAQAVVGQIDPERRIVDHILSRESCTWSKIDGSSSSSACGRGKGRRSGERGPTSVVKDLEVVGRPLSKVIMVENSLDAIRYHLENGVHISSFYGDREDTELLSTLEALKALAPMADVRDGIIRLSVETQARKEGHTLMPDGSISPKA